MKHLSTMLLAIGLATTSAIAQNVTVFMKDGSSHKFNTDYVSEMSFKEISTVETVEFNQVSVNPYSNGNVSLTFTNAEGNTTLVADVYCGSDAIWFQPGTYTVDGSNDAFTMDPSWSSLTVDGEKTNITSGTMNVTLEGAIYSFDIDLTLEGGSQFKAKYTGELDRYTQCLKVNLSAAKYLDNPQNPGTFYVKYNDADWKYEMAIVFVGNASDTQLQPGTYTYSETAQAGTISSLSYVDCYSPNANLKLQAGSSVTVTKDGDNYTMAMDLIFNDGRTGDFNYTGAISGTPTFNDPNPIETVEFNQISVNPYNTNNIGLTFTDATNNIVLALDTYCGVNTVFYRPGTYTIDGSNDAFTMDPSWSSLTVDGEKTNITSGTMNVTLEGRVYSFDINLTLEDGNQFKGVYTGELDKFGPHLNVTLSAAKYLDNPQNPGTFYVKYNDADWKYEMAIVFVGNAADTQLQPGTYTYSETAQAGTISSLSYVDCYNPNANLKLMAGSSVTVTKDGDNYTMAMDLIFNDGRTGDFNYTGEISGTPVFE